jgi:hypothetical protein
MWIPSDDEARIREAAALPDSDPIWRCQAVLLGRCTMRPWEYGHVLAGLRRRPWTYEPTADELAELDRLWHRYRGQLARAIAKGRPDPEAPSHPQGRPVTRWRRGRAHK